MGYYDINDDSYEELTEMTKPRYLSVEYSKSGRAMCRECNKYLNLRELRFAYHQTQTEHFHESKKYVHPQCLRKVLNIGHIFKRMNTAEQFRNIKGVKQLIPLDQKQIPKIIQELYKLHQKGKLKKEQEDSDEDYEEDDSSSSESEISNSDSDDNSDSSSDSSSYYRKKKAPVKKQQQQKQKTLNVKRKNNQNNNSSSDNETDSDIDNQPKKKIKIEKYNYLTQVQYNQIVKQMVKSEKLTKQQKNEQLDKNNFYTFQNPNADHLNYFHAEAVVLGGVEQCQVCGGGKLKFFNTKSEYQCMGFEDEDGKFDCGQTYQFDEIKRVQWIN